MISWKQLNLFLLIKGICETIKNETEKQKGRFLGMLLSTLDASLLFIM